MQLSLKAAAGPCRDPSIPAAGVADGYPIIDNLSWDREIGTEGEDGVISAPTGARAGTHVVTKEERLGTPQVDIYQTSPDLVDPKHGIDIDDGWGDKLSPPTFREQRVARAREVLVFNEPKQDRGDQANQAAAEDHRHKEPSNLSVRAVMRRLSGGVVHADGSKVPQLLKSQDESVIREAGNFVPQVIQACEVCQSWKQIADVAIIEATAKMQLQRGHFDGVVNEELRALCAAAGDDFEK